MKSATGRYSVFSCVSFWKGKMRYGFQTRYLPRRAILFFRRRISRVSARKCLYGASVSSEGYSVVLDTACLADIIIFMSRMYRCRVFF